MGPFLTPGAWLAGFKPIYREDHYTLLHTKYVALGLVVSEKKTFLCFSHDAPGAWPVWTPGAWLAGFIKRITIHCYKQNRKALSLVVSEKKILFMFFPFVSLWELMTPRGGAIFDPRTRNNHTYT